MGVESQHSETCLNRRIACMKTIGVQMEQNRNYNSSRAGGASDGGDAVMVRWLQTAGLQHLTTSLSAAALDHQILPSLLMQTLFLAVPPVVRTNLEV